MKKYRSNELINEYDKLFTTCMSLVGQKIEQINFYLDEDDFDFNEQPNEYGKSLLNSIELTITGQKYCLGNLFLGTIYNGLSILKGKTTDFESIEDKKNVIYPSEIVGQVISQTTIYWTKSHNGNYLVPQEIELRGETNFLLCSAIEVNNGELNCPLTDEILVLENDFGLIKFQLGKYGIGTNKRYVFNNVEELLMDEV